MQWILPYFLDINIDKLVLINYAWKCQGHVYRTTANNLPHHAYTQNYALILSSYVGSSQGHSSIKLKSNRTHAHCPNYNNNHQRQSITDQYKTTLQMSTIASQQLYMSILKWACSPQTVKYMVHICQAHVFPTFCYFSAIFV